jgi:arsenate reductase
MERKRVLFVCTHNSARSQMAEGLLNAVYGKRYIAFSAGTEPSNLNPYAVEVMSEIGIDISNQRSKSVEEFRNEDFDYVVTLCDSAKETCPIFSSGKKYLHETFDDPSDFKGTEDEEVRLRFRRVRDQIQEWVRRTFG